MNVDNAMQIAKSTFGNEAERIGYRYVMFFIDQVLFKFFFSNLGKYEVTETVTLIFW